MANHRALKTLGLVALALISACVYIVYSHRYNSIYGTATLVCIFFALALLLPGWKIDKLPRWQRVFFSAVIFLIMFAGYFGLMELTELYKENELRRHGKITKGVIVGFKDERSRYRHFHYAIVDYPFNNQSYTQKFRDEEHNFDNSDSVTMICSENDPELCTIIK